MKYDPLEDGSGTLTNYDYEFLSGNDTFWSVKGSAFIIVSEWLNRRGYGTYGEPTDRGRRAMSDFKQRQGS